MKKFYPILLCMAGLLGMNTACDDSDEGQGQGPEKESVELQYMIFGKSNKDQNEKKS